ncbi:M1 family metallopeptidase [Psychrosphaera sp. F3M07]|uniref:M1 family metallopeptidase n=1 Tax=Psychrosphaera sp. F3M07 TaxID=2841560 RepID=UPI001C086BC9|nr:M1 family metallopeptidase [Psychrosphaera sp. F3M07]MBU2919683.1 M1 family metallopeptidase [Psychrosphaera sp. F3M07]
MKTFFKWLIYFIITVVIIAVGINFYNNWQQQIDEQEKALAPLGQLPENIEPTHYDLTLRVDPDQGTFSGEVIIDVNLKTPSTELWLHSENITVSTANFITTDNQTTPLTFKEMGHSGVARLTSSTELPAQSASIHFVFNGELASDLSGLYLVKDGGLNYAFTQFESVFARMAFPSFDEPRFKTTYDIKLEVKDQHKGFTNTPQIAESQLSDGFKQLTFATTKPLPTYLIAFAVGDLDVVEYANIPTTAIRDKEIPLRGIATKGKGKDLTYALENTADILAELEKYFAIPYPYEKLDIVAVPDFAAGAMENAGLITYREQLLLLGDNPTLDQQRSYASVHAHELAHQWFGNLVTMQWWDDIWLNESFATWMADITMNEWNPDFGFARGMVRSGHGVMKQDVFVDTRQIREPINNNGDIKNAFDGITYQKGGAMLQMLEDYVGKDDFREGVRYHMQRFAFGNATAIDFIDSIEHFTEKQNIKVAFESFLNQKGVPLISVDYQCDDAGVTADISQTRYLPIGARSSSDQTWTLPVCLTLVNNDNNREVCTLLDQPSDTLTIAGAQCPVAVMPNTGGKGYYRWTMPAQKQQSLMSNFGKLDGSEKYSVASNLVAEFRAGRISVSEYLVAIKTIVSDTDWDLVTQPVGEIEFISNNLAGDDDQVKISQYLNSLYDSKLESLGLYANTQADLDDPVATKLLRKKIISLVALTLKQPELLNQLAQMGEEVIGYNKGNQLNTSELDPELLLPALASGVELHGLPFAKAVLAQLENTDDGTLRQQLLTAVARSNDPAVSELVLDTITSLSIRVNERITLLVTHMSRKENQRNVYQWFKDKFSFIELVIPKKYLGYTPMIGSGFCSKEMRDDVEAFFTAKLDQLAGAEHHLSTTLERIEMCSQLKAQQQGINL